MLCTCTCMRMILMKVLLMYDKASEQLVAAVVNFECTGFTQDKITLLQQT